MCNRKFAATYFTVLSFYLAASFQHIQFQVWNIPCYTRFERSKHQTPHDINSIFEQTNVNLKINGEIWLPMLVWLSKEKGKINCIWMEESITNMFLQPFYAEPLSMIDITYGGLLFLKAFHVTDCTNHLKQRIILKRKRSLNWRNSTFLSSFTLQTHIKCESMIMRKRRACFLAEKILTLKGGK